MHDAMISYVGAVLRWKGRANSPLLAALYFVSYVVLSSYMIMSVLIAVVMSQGRIPSSQCLPQECIR